MWVVCMFDLPTHTKEARRAYSIFRKNLLKDGFSMMQYSVYVRHCASLENAQLHVRRIRILVPDEGEIRFLTITDHQFDKIVTILGKKIVPNIESTPKQLELF